MRQLPFILFFAIFFAACKPEASTSDTPPAQDTPTTEVPNTSVQQTPPENPLLNSREGQLLLRNFWVFEYYIIPNNHPASVENRGRWYAFSADGTFKCGHWEEQTGTGVWYLFNDGKPKVRLDATDDTQDAEWELQFAGDGDVASWIGTSTYINNKGVMAKAINLLTMPTKKQFGYE